MRYFVAILLICLAIFLVVDDETLAFLSSLNIKHFLLSVGLCWLVLIISGIRLTIAMTILYGKPLSWVDVITLPVVMTFWGVLLPVKGGMIYSIFYLKSKYQLDMSRGAAVSLFTYLVMLTVFGIVIFAIILSQGEASLWVVLLATFLTFIYPLLFVFHRLLSFSLQGRSFRFMTALRGWLADVLQNLSVAMRHRRLVFLTGLISLLHLGVTFLWFAFADYVLGLSLSYLALTCLVLISHLSIIFRFLPGGIGVTEIAMGLTVALVDSSLESGILVALYLRVSGLLLTLVLGGAVGAYHVKRLDIPSIASLSNRLRKGRA